VTDTELSFAKESVNQVITLSSGILALSLTFAKDWAGVAEHPSLWVLRASWIGFLASIVFGVWSLSAITGLASRKAGSTQAWGLRGPWIGELVTFAAGLGLFTFFGFKAI